MCTDLHRKQRENKTVMEKINNCEHKTVNCAFSYYMYFLVPFVFVSISSTQGCTCTLIICLLLFSSYILTLLHPSPGFSCIEDTGAVPSCHLARSAGHETRFFPPTACPYSSPWLSWPATSSLQQQHGCLCHGRHWSHWWGTATSARHGGCALSCSPHHHHPQQIRCRWDRGNGSSYWWVGWLWLRHAWLQAVTEQALHQGGVHGKWCSLSPNSIFGLFYQYYCQN